MDVEKDENTIADNVIEFWFADASNSPENAFSRKTSVEFAVLESVDVGLNWLTMSTKLSIDIWVS